MGAPVFTASDFLEAFQNLLPTGPVWPRDADAPASQFIGAMMKTYERLCARDAHLLVDAFPVAPVELLPEWESSLGLPDPCAGPSPTLEQRQRQVNARFIGRGGQSAAYFISVAAALGYTASVSIMTFSPSRFGRAFGLPFGGAQWSYVWQLITPSGPNDPALVCEITRLAPAHTVPLFKFT